MTVNRSANPLESIGGVLNTAKVTMVPSFESADKASEVMKGLRKIPAPVGPYKRQFIDPSPSIGAGSCDRDYGMACPLPFKHVGTINQYDCMTYII